MPENTINNKVIAIIVFLLPLSASAHGWHLIEITADKGVARTVDYSSKKSCEYAACKINGGPCTIEEKKEYQDWVAEDNKAREEFLASHPSCKGEYSSTNMGGPQQGFEVEGHCIWSESNDPFHNYGISYSGSDVMSAHCYKE